MKNDRVSTVRNILIAGLGATTLALSSAAVATYGNEDRDHESEIQQHELDQQQTGMQGLDSNAETAQVPPQPSWDDWDTDDESDDDDDDDADIYFP